MPERDGAPPNPSTPVGHVAGWYLRAECGVCDHGSACPIDDLVQLHRLPSDTPLWRLVCRLRCSRCGKQPAAIELLDGVDTAAPPRAMRRVRLV